MPETKCGKENYGKGAMRFRNNFERWIIGKEKHTPKLYFQQGLYLFLVSLRILFYLLLLLKDRYSAMKVEVSLRTTAGFFTKKIN